MQRHPSTDADSDAGNAANGTGAPVDQVTGASLADVLARLKTTAEGLGTEEAGRRLTEYGPNDIPEERTSPIRKFLSYFWGPIPWMIEVAVALSAAARHWEDFGIILVLLLANAVVGFWEEYQAGNTIAALQAQLARRARVKRDGQWASIDARELVPGDVIRLRLGDIVPADAYLMPGDPIQVDQSALTGESLPVTHAAGESVYSGSIVRQGEIDAVAVATGMQTYFGKTARLVEATRTVSHFQQAVIKIGDYLILLALALVTLIVAVALARKDNMITTLEFALVLTVAAIPVALPTVLSVAMAVGARMLARKQAIVSHLASIEELAGIDILCSDKTGTLTQNKLTVGEPFCMDGVDRQALMTAAALASRAEDNDPIDAAVLGALPSGRPGGFHVDHFQPFDPVRKRTEVSVTAPDGTHFSVTKGAPQVIQALAEDAAVIRPQVDDAVEAFAAKGYRSLGVARADQPGRWRFLGVIPLFDPPRDDSKATIDAAEGMGMTVKMLTGDQLAIAKETAKQLGLGSNIVDAGIFGRTLPHQAGQLAEAIERADGFAQVYPEHKYYIVDVMQQCGHIVGMTGDGVNDAPALKKADAGIAVAAATDAARSAADIVLLTPGLSVIVDAVRESRRIFRRMISYAIYRIAETIRVLLFMTLSILVFNIYPVTAVMIVLLALLNDGAILSIAYDHVKYSNRPERWDMPIALGVASVLGVVGVVASFGVLYLGERVLHLDYATIQTLVYLKLSVAGHLTIFITRTRGPFWSVRPARILVGAVFGTQALATIIAATGILMSPIGWKLAAFVWVYALAWFLVNDRVKLAAYRIFDRAQPGILTPKRHRRLPIAG
jgi:H+-transporting ATPase